MCQLVGVFSWQHEVLLKEHFCSCLRYLSDPECLQKSCSHTPLKSQTFLLKEKFTCFSVCIGNLLIWHSTVH